MKVSCAITAYQAGHMAPSTATFLFGAAHLPVVVMAREMDRTANSHPSEPCALFARCISAYHPCGSWRCDGCT